LSKSPAFSGLDEFEIAFLDECDRDRSGDFRAFVSVRAAFEVVKTLYYYRWPFEDCCDAIHLSGSRFSGWQLLAIIARNRKSLG